MRRRIWISCLVIISSCLMMVPAFSIVSGSYQIPFEGMKLVYYSESTQILLQQTGLAGVGWITLTFHDVSSNSTKMDVNVNGTVTRNGNEVPENTSATTDFPTNTDTLIFLRNGGQPNLQIYAGAAGQAIQIIPGFSFQLNRSWELHDQALAKTALGSFAVYRYHTSLGFGSLSLDFYASYEKVTQLLVYGEVYANENGATSLLDKLELRETNVQFSNSQSTSPQCIIATAAFGSELASPVQFLRNFRDEDVDRTFLGHHFLSAFNAWYYSWAPSVARVESGNSDFRAAVRTVILPLLGTLYVSSLLFGWLHFNSELAVFLSGIVAGALLGAAYLSPVALAISHLLKGRIRGATFAEVVVLGLILTFAGTLGHGRTDIFENLTALTVIETALVSSVLVGFILQTLTCRK